MATGFMASRSNLPAFRVLVDYVGWRLYQAHASRMRILGMILGAIDRITLPSFRHQDCKIIAFDHVADREASQGSVAVAHSQKPTS